MPRSAALKKGKRGVEEAVSYALGHRIRVEILAALHEGIASPGELAKTLGQGISTVTHHVDALLASDSIELAKTEERGNVEVHFYRGTKLSAYSSKEWAELSEAERQVTAALIIQSISAEVLASLWAGKISGDPLVTLAWNRIHLDQRAREEMAEEHDRSWERIGEIEAQSAHRRAHGEEVGKSATHVVAAYGFERSRTEAPEPAEF